MTLQNLLLGISSPKAEPDDDSDVQFDPAAFADVLQRRTSTQGIAEEEYVEDLFEEDVAEPTTAEVETAAEE